MKIETDLKKLKQTAMKNDDENWEFRSFLKCIKEIINTTDSLLTMSILIKRIPRSSAAGRVHCFFSS